MPSRGAMRNRALTRRGGGGERSPPRAEAPRFRHGPEGWSPTARHPHDVVMRPMRPMSTQKPQGRPRPTPSSAAPAIPDVHAALAALLAALAGRGMALPQAPDPVIPRKAAARLLGLSEATFDRVCRRGDGPAALRLSARRVGFRMSDLMAWTATRRAGGVCG